MMKRTQTQKLIDFTVQIRHFKTNEIVGTGVVVSADGKVITCAHVASAAGIESHDPESRKIGVYFPKTRIREAKACCAKVSGYFPNHDDDVVLLQISEAISLKNQEIAVLGSAENSAGNPFRSYGFRSLGLSPSGYAGGEIMGSVLPFADKKLLVDPIELRTRDIRPGMSGAGVLDTERNLVVGLVTQRWNPGDSSINDNIAWAVDSYVLKFEPINSLDLFILELV